MRASEAPRVLKRITTAVRKCPDVNDGELIICGSVAESGCRKRRKSRAIIDVWLAGTTIYAAGAIEQIWIGSAPGFQKSMQPGR
jgi:hypothetical protein